MTTIVGIQGDGWTVMAADSQITDENSKIISPDTPKIIRFNNILIGLRGDARPGDIISYNWKPPKITGDPQRWLVSKMIPSMIDAFDEFGYDWEHEEADFNFMVSIKGNLFDIGTDMSISKADQGLFFSGSGGKIALGYMASQDYSELEDAQRVAVEAVAVAAVFDIHTSEPIQVEIG
jgi:ATP-dependent protease HslVU (ClpYQ) peptidase subunit